MSWMLDFPKKFARSIRRIARIAPRMRTSSTVCALALKRRNLRTDTTASRVSHRRHERFIGEDRAPRRFLADENFETAIVQGVKRQRPDCVFFTADEAGIRNLLDDLVLRRAQELGLILVSHDLMTMYDHFATLLMSLEAVSIQQESSVRLGAADES